MSTAIAPRPSNLVQTGDDRLIDAYLPITALLETLETDAGDVSAALQLCRAYLQLGLIGPAKDLLGSSDALLALPEAADLLDGCALFPSGRVAWSSLQIQFERNLQKLLIARPNLRTIEQSLRSAPKRLELYRSRDGNLHVATRNAGKLNWKDQPIDSIRLVSDSVMPHPEGTLVCAPYAICHDRGSMLLAKLFAATSKMFLNFSPRLYQCSTDADDLAVSLYMSEDVEHLCHPRVELLIGQNWAELLKSTLLNDPQRPMPEAILSLTSRGSMQVEMATAIRQVIDIRRQQLSDNVAVNEQDYLRPDLTVWQHYGKQTRTRGLRILGITSRFTTVLQYSMRDLAAAFERRGHSFRILMDPTDHDVLPHEQIAQVIRDDQPDLVFSIDHLRYEFRKLIPAGMPYVCWIQDLLPHLMTKKAGNSIGPRDFYIAPSLHQFLNTYDYPKEQGLAWTMATNAALYDARPLPDSELQSYVCDFSYVSNQSTIPAAFHHEYRRRVASSLGKRLCDHIYEMLVPEFDTGPGLPRSAMQIMAEARVQCGLQPADAEGEDRLARNFIHPLTELLFRQTSLNWVADYCDEHGLVLALYGRGWEIHPRFSKYARGQAGNGAMLRAIYQATKINLQINGYGAIHQRLLDGLSSGGFFLIRSSPIDRIHTSAQQLLELVTRYGINPGTHAATNYPALPEAWRAANLARGITKEMTGSITLTREELDCYRELQIDGFRRVAGAVFGEYADITFANAAEFRKMAEDFLREPELRRICASSMRKTVLEKYTYDALVSALLAFIAGSLAKTAD